MQDLHLIRSTGVDVVVDPTALSRGGFTTHCQGVTVECGPKGQPEAVDNAYAVLRNFLAANGVIDEGYDYSTDPELFRIFDRIDYPSEETELHVVDFGIVREGEVFLTVDGEDIEAEQDFYPVMASDGDLGPPFVGFKAKNEGTVSERLLSGP